MSEQEFFPGRHVQLLGWTLLRDHPPPKPPFQCYLPYKKGTNLLLYEFCIHPHTHQDLKLNRCRVMGQKLKHGRPCTHDLPGTHNWLAQSHIPHCFHCFRIPLMLAHSWKFGVKCCSIGLAHPAACTRACVPPTFVHVNRPPLFPNLVKKGGNRLRLS